MNVFRLLLTLIALLVGNQAFAANEDCSAGNASDQEFCFFKKLKTQNVEIKKLIDEIDHEMKSDWGEAALPELRERLRVGQAAWEKYQESVCEYDYYTKAPVHPSSVNAAMIYCKLKMGEQRIDEINKLYHPDL